MLRHPPSNNQRATAMFVALGHSRTHLRRTAGVLEERAVRISGLLPRLLPAFRWRRDPGATSFWVEGPADLDARDLSVRARARGVRPARIIGSVAKCIECRSSSTSAWS